MVYYSMKNVKTDVREPVTEAFERIKFHIVQGTWIEVLRKVLDPTGNLVSNQVLSKIIDTYDGVPRYD